MPDSFPEAFDRFEEDMYGKKGIPKKDKYNDIVRTFISWQEEKMKKRIITEKQELGIQMSLKDRGFYIPKRVRKEPSVMTRRGREYYYLKDVKGKFKAFWKKLT